MQGHLRGQAGLQPTELMGPFTIEVVERSYVDRAAGKPRQLTYGAIYGMVDALGDTGHSYLLSGESRWILGPL